MVFSSVSRELVRHNSFCLLCGFVLSYHLEFLLNFVFGLHLCWLTWFLIIAIPTIVLAIVRPRLKVPAKDKAVLITGCDSGFGFTLAKALYEQGCTVFAGCLVANKGGSKELSEIDPQRLHVIQLDVTSQSQVDKAVEYVNKNLPDPGKGLWAVVNNAGNSNFGYVEWLSMKQYKDMAEVNLWGTIRVAQAFLPLIRKAKGRVINMSSMLGVYMKPSRSAYGVTKYGVEAFSDALRYEMRPFGVDVCMLEPGNFTSATNVWSIDQICKQERMMWDENMSDEVKSSYGNLFKLEVFTMKSYINAGIQDQSLVIDAYLDAIFHRYPYDRYRPSALLHHIMMLLGPHIPPAFFEKLFYSTPQI